MSSQALARARANRAGDRAPPVSGNRPVTSIGSQAAFAQQMPPGVGYNMPPPPNNVRVARSMQPPPNSKVSPQNQYHEQPHTNTNSLPFQKLSISDAIGLITLRLGRVEQWIIESENDPEEKHSSSGIPDNHRVIDNSVLASIVSRLDSLEKNTTTGSNDDFKALSEQFKRMGDDVSKHTIELAKNTEQVYRFNRELTETKDILKSFMVKYDMFTQEMTQTLGDYELALAELEKKLPVTEEVVETEAKEEEQNNDIIMSTDLKNMIKQELSGI